MRKFLTVSLVAMVMALAFGYYATAQSNYTDSSSWTKAYPSESIKLGNGGVQFFMVTYSIDRFGAVSATTTNDIDLGVDIPDNFVITHGYADVIEAVLPATNSVALTLNTSGDLFAMATNTFSTTGIKALVPVGTAATSVKATAARDLTLQLYDTAGQAITSGIFKVYLAGFQSQ